MGAVAVEWEKSHTAAVFRAKAGWMYWGEWSPSVWDHHQK